MADFAIKKTIKKIFTHFPFENIVCRLSQGRSVQSLIGKFVPVNRLYPPNTIRNVTRHGIRYCLDISDYQNWLIYFGLTNDQPVGLFELVRADQTILDIGTNIGQTALKFAKLGGNKSTVIGFEPHPKNFQAASKNASLNDFPHLTILNLGLGSSKAKLLLSTGTFNSGGNSITTEESNTTVLVDIEKLDDVVTTKNLSSIDLIKIDVEGFEMEVLKGAEQILRKFTPILFIELDDNHLKQQRSSAKELVHFLLERNYHINHSETNEPITEITNFNNCHYDIVCKCVKG